MTLRRRILDWTLTAILVAIPALVLRASLQRQEPSGLDRAVLRITAPLQAVTTWLAEAVGSVWSGYVALVDVERENEELRADNQRLREELFTMTTRATRVTELEQLVEAKRQILADTIGAHVISAPVSQQFRVLRLRIDRGADDVQPDMAVLWGASPVGKVDKVFGDYADVILISDPRSKIDVVVRSPMLGPGTEAGPGPGKRGFLVGLGRTDSYACGITSLELAHQPAQRVKVGDIVETSGVGSLFPAGLRIGTVTKLEGDDGMFQKVEVEPEVDVSTVRAVTVLLAPPPPSDPDTKTKPRSEPAFGARAW